MYVCVYVLRFLHNPGSKNRHTILSFDTIRRRDNGVPAIYFSLSLDCS